MVLGLLEEIAFPSVAGEGAAGTSCGGFALLSIMTPYSAVDFFCSSRAACVLSANNLPAATCFGFFAGSMVGVGEVPCCVVSAAGVSGSFCCSVNIVPCDAPIIFCSKGNRLVGCKAITHNYSVIGQRLFCIAQVFLPILLQHLAHQNQCALW